MIMKGTFAILLPCLLALTNYTHLVSAQNFRFLLATNTIPYDDVCEDVDSLSVMCKRQFIQAVVGNNPDPDPFCTGNCFESVLEAYQSCNDTFLSNRVVQLIARGE